MGYICNGNIDNDITINQIHYKSGRFGEEFFLKVENYGWLHVVISFMEGVSVCRA